jgi:hypothetical protein
MLDESGGVAKLTSLDALAALDHVEFGVMAFEPRPRGANELHLQAICGSGYDICADTVIARFVGQPEAPSVYNIRTILVGTTRPFAQNGHRISFEGWVPPPLPAIETPVATDLPEGIRVVDKATFKVESPDRRQVDYVYLQFFSDGRIVGTVVK